MDARPVSIPIVLRQLCEDAVMSTNIQYSTVQ